MENSRTQPSKEWWLTMDLRAEEHSDEDSLERYFIGSLDQQSAKQIEEHLLICHVCIEKARDIEHYVQAMRRALKEDRSTGQPAGSR